MKTKSYICIDLKSFYASVECMERNLDPMTTNLVVADPSRTEKTICLAVTPSLKSFGIPGRARLFEVVQKVKEVNGARKRKLKGAKFSGKSCSLTELQENEELELDYIVAPPRMALYMEYSTRIYDVYLKFIAPEDIHVYSIDEVFIDVTDYLGTYKTTASELAKTIIKAVLLETGITATAGVGTNMYLAKIAMDIVAKRMPADEDGARIACLDEMSYRHELWNHKPLTDFWRVGKGYIKKLEANRLYTMGDIAKASLTEYGENLLYKLFGVNAELLIDHAWGYEPCTIAHVKSYKPMSKSVGSGQVLHCPYDFEKTRIIVREMTELLVLDLVEKKFVTDQIVLTIGYDAENLVNSNYKGEVTIDHYGRKIPKHAHGTINLGEYTSSTSLIIQKTLELYESISKKDLLVRRVNIVANHIADENTIDDTIAFEQLDIFTDYENLIKMRQKKKEDKIKERNLQEAMIEIKNKFGKNAVLKGTNLCEGATTLERNRQIGGHRA